MRYRRLLFLLLITALIWTGVPGYAQNQDFPLVVFILDDDLQTASVADPGPDGLTQLEYVFKSLGARTTYASLDQALPEEARVVVMVRPWRRLSVPALARLWLHLARGNHLLLAIDPVGQAGAQPENARSGLATLLTWFYGISLQDTFAVEPWFTLDTITTQRTAYSWTYPEGFVHHPVTEPLASYELPVLVWGARSMVADPFGLDSFAFPLIYTRSAYGEATAEVFGSRNGEPAPLELNLGEDTVGTLIIGALAENTRTGSRVVLLGDSELVQNNFGLALSTTGGPLHPGDQILVERLAAWLLERPIENWPSLPTKFTWLAIDGSGSDWGDETPPPVLDEDEESSTPLPGYDIQQVRAFRDDSYLYVLIETGTAPDPEAVRLTLGLDTDGDGETDTTLLATANEVMLLGDEDTQSAVVDGSMAVGEALEARLPLRVVGESPLISELCLSDSRTPPPADPLDCVAQRPINVPDVGTQAPHDSYFPPGPLVTVLTAAATGRINLRAGPGTEYPILATLGIGHVLRATGRNEAGDWIQIQNARYTGWLAEYVTIPNGDLATLPVVESP
jgi:hypothetical protein